MKFYSPHTAQAQSVLYQMRQFEKLSILEQQQKQIVQLKKLVNHALKHSPFWREKLITAGFNKNDIDSFNLSDLPILTRSDLQESSNNIKARWQGSSEQDFYTSISSGSTGVPVRVEKFKTVQV